MFICSLRPQAGLNFSSESYDKTLEEQGKLNTVAHTSSPTNARSAPSKAQQFCSNKFCSYSAAPTIFRWNVRVGVGWGGGDAPGQGRLTWGNGSAEARRTFSGLRSQCTMFLKCKCRRATRI